MARSPSTAGKSGKSRKTGSKAQKKIKSTKARRNRARASGAATAAGSLIDRAIAAETEANEAGRGDWLLYATHRNHLTQAILTALPRPGPEAAVACLGAGNCNDLDLKALSTAAGRVALVDLDGQALKRGAEQLPQAQRGQLQLLAPVDLTGLLAKLGEVSQTTTAATCAGWVSDAVSRVASSLGSGSAFDVVASCCVMTQMSWALTQALGAGHSLLPNLREAVVQIHLRSMARLLKPGGRMLLSCDLISSEHYPLDALPEGTDLKQLMPRFLATGNYYQGANPLLVRRLLSRDEELSRVLGAPNALEPWLWQGPKGRIYFVYALVAKRRLDASL